MSEPPARDVALNNLQLQQMLDAFRFSLEQTLANGQNLQLPATGQPPEPPTPDEPVDQPADPPSGRALGKYAAMAREPAPAAGPSVPRIVPKPPAKNTKRGQQLRKTMEKTYRGDEELAKSAYDELMRDLSEAVYVGNPFTLQHHQDAYTAHVDICLAHKLCNEDQCWDIDTIRKHAEFSLVYRIKHARGPNGPIQSRTALSWLTHFVYNICVYTRDPATGKLAGLVVMREGLYNTLEQRTRWAVQEYGLLRHPKKQVRLDMAAIQLIIEQVLTSSKSGLKRSPGLQTINGLLLGFYGAFRSGSMISSHKDYQEKEMFLKVGDCDLPVEKPGRFKLVVKIDNWKGYNGSVGESMTFTFDPVNKAHNVNFDLPLSVAVDFMSRGFFVGITSVKELFDFAGSHLPIDPKYKKYPVFTARTARGLDIIEGQPIRINGLTASISHHGAQAGIAGATIHAIRRGTSDAYGVGLGKDRSMLIMNHGQRLGKIFDNYTSGVETIPLVGVRLEEFSGSWTPLERKIMSNVKLISPAIDCVIRRSQATGGPLGAGAKNWQAVTPEEEEQLKADPNIGPLLAEHQAAWLNYASLFPNVHAPYSKECRRQVPKLQSHITPATSQQAAIRLQTFDNLNARLTSVRRKGLLKIRKSAKKEALNTRPNATAAERAAAKEQMDKESVLFDDAKAMYQAETTKYLNAKATRLTLTPAQATALQLPEPVRVKLANLPEATEDTQADSDDDDEETQMVAEALPGKGTSKDQVPDFQLNFLPVHNSKRAGPNPKETETEETEIEEDIPTTLGDKDQPDVFGIDVDLFRMIYARYLYGPIEQARNRALAKRSDKHFVCLKCPSFLSRVEKLTKQLEKKGKDTSKIEFTFSTEINYNRHMRVQHCAWMELELEMQQEDSDMLICPGCQAEFASIAAAHKHCRTDCPKKDEFIPLFNDYQTAKPTINPLVVQEQANRRREQKWENKDIPITKAGLEIVRKLKNDLEAYPGAFEEWFKSVPKAETLEMSMTELQDEYIEIILVALQTIKETGEEEVFYTKGLKPTAMTELFMESYNELKCLREDHPSDYDESTDEEVNKDGEANE